MFGLDISSSSVKLVELGRDKAGNLMLQACAIEPLERGWITDGNIEKFDEVAGALKRLVKKSGTKTKNVAMALPPSAVITEENHLAWRHVRPGVGATSRKRGQSVHPLSIGRG